ncbi:MAG: hypothetical protein M3M85_01430, partial [bacterium]|nr:hypothetical protein [bacterium]
SLTATEGTLYIEPSSVSLTVGGEARVQAYYQPSMLPCREGMACAQMMPAPIKVNAVWSVSNNTIAELRHIDCAVLGGCGGTTSVKGLSAGTAELKATYTPPGGTSIVAFAKVSVASLLSVCPEEWIQNRMPGIVGDTTPKEYYIYKGVRRELSEFDVSWVKTNCSITPEITY